MKISYRPEIDGLRALAVLSVVFYHTKFIYLTMKYLGEDLLVLIYFLYFWIFNYINNFKRSIS